jgi:8-oxo-dGTP pyrophosphatase MutT (NUDIX family)
LDAAAAIDRRLDRFSADSPASDAAGAAVIAVLRAGRAGEEVLLMERAVRFEDPASGQVSLPGGHVEAVDQTLRDTALRELAEEIGLGRNDLTAPPRFLAIEAAPRFSLHVGVFAGRLGPHAEGALSPSPHEVADVFWLPLRSLSDLTTVTRETRQGLGPVDAVVRDSHVVWGFTLRILRKYFGEP